MRAPGGQPEIGDREKIEHAKKIERAEVEHAKEIERAEVERMTGKVCPRGCHVAVSGKNPGVVAFLAAAVGDRCPECGEPLRDATAAEIAQHGQRFESSLREPDATTEGTP